MIVSSYTCIQRLNIHFRTSFGVVFILVPLGFLPYRIPPTGYLPHGIPPTWDSSQTGFLPNGIPPKRDSSQTRFLPNGISPKQNSSHIGFLLHGIPPARDSSRTMKDGSRSYMGCMGGAPASSAGGRHLTGTSALTQGQGNNPCQRFCPGHTCSNDASW